MSLKTKLVIPGANKEQLAAVRKLIDDMHAISTESTEQLAVLLGAFVVEAGTVDEEKGQAICNTLFIAIETVREFWIGQLATAEELGETVH